MENSSTKPPHVELIVTDLATVSVTAPIDGDAITEAEVFEAQRLWATGVLEIGALFLSGGDYVNRTHEFTDTLYGYDEGPVLFKPTLANTHPFRSEKNEANSYFIGGIINEDLGFAIRPWEQVQFCHQQVLLRGGTALAMGYYQFTEYNSTEVVTAEFSFGYFRSKDESVRINLHHSSLPYTPTKP